MPPLLEFKLFSEPILAIESSCDETSAAIVQGLEIKSNVVASQIDLHRTTGGVVPERAARAHVEAILPTIEGAQNLAGVQLQDLRAVGATNRPGLIGSLSVGVCAAKAIAFDLAIPWIGIDHLEGHLLSPLAHDPNLPFPWTCLLVSGGHTELVEIARPLRYRPLGQTLDDAAGEAFDKTARLLGFDYPGGRALSEAAESGDPGRYRLPRYSPGQGYDFSFSGLKTAVLRLVESEGSALRVEDAAASIEAAIVEPLVERTLRASEDARTSAIALAGGVAANLRLRAALAQGAARMGVPFAAAPPELCTDNAAMIGIAAAFRLGAGERSGWEMDCSATSSLWDGSS